MNALLVTTDLMASSSAEGAARRAGVALRVVGPNAAAERADDATRLVAIDLMSVADVAPLVASLREACPTATVLAYGPHVQEERLAAAQAAGCDPVLARGSFFKQVGQLLEAAASGAAPGASTE